MKNLFLLLFMAAAFSTSGQSFFNTVSGKCSADSPVELGVKFTTTQGGFITGLRFYKCSAGTQVYYLKLYAGGTVVATTSFQGTATGWQNVPINPYRIAPGVTYTASYFTTSGQYQAIQTYTWPVTAGPLIASGSVYLYKAANNNTLPTDVFQTSNYFMDIVYQSDTTVLPPVNQKDTVVLPCYPPDSSLIITNGNTIEKYFYFFKTVYRDTGRIVYNNVYIHDTIQAPPVYIRDTIVIRDTVPYRYPVPYYDTVKVYKTEIIYDTSQVILAWDGVDSTNYDAYLKANKYMKVLETWILPDPMVRWRFVEYIDKVIRKEESQDGGKTWKRVVPTINDTP